MSIEIPAAEQFRQKTDDLQGYVLRFASIAVAVLDPLRETASERPLKSQECDAGDEAIFSLKKAIADLYAHRESG